MSFYWATDDDEDEDGRTVVYEFTFEFSTGAFTCVGHDCGKTVSHGTRILFTNDRQEDLCVDCARKYLKETVERLRGSKTLTYSITDNTASAYPRSPMISCGDVLNEGGPELIFDDDAMERLFPDNQQTPGNA